MEYTVLCAGKLKERFYAEACAEYLKRMPDARLLEFPEIKGPDGLKKEAKAFLEAMPPRSLKIALCVEGRPMSSEELAGLIRDAENRGVSRLCAVIGSSDGLAEEVKARCDLRLSLSKMTFPHHLARVMVLEQLYRAREILKGSRYHK